MKKNISKLGITISKNRQKQIKGGVRGVVPCSNIRDCFFLGDDYIGDYFCMNIGRGYKECVLL